jgi:hypothetical protein
MKPEHDPQLQALFARGGQEFRDDAFVQNVIQRIEARDSRRTVVRSAFWVAGLIGVAIVSPFLIEGVSWLSDGLDSLFSSTNRVLYTPAGARVAIVLSIALFVLNRKRIWVK